ncbi:MAG: zinc-ribbon domain-containing protein, partial [Gammaproteobacteria bacterium]
MTTRACTACGTPNEADARFCEGCGTALERVCGACGVTVSPTARFCKGCGAPLDGEANTPAAGPTRKIVTVLFADLAGSTAFEEIVDAETAREVIGRYHELLRSTVERHRV